MPVKILTMLREWQAIKQAHALHFAGSTEADAALAESKRYGMAADEIERLRNAIEQTLDENGHLADGDNCTLIVLKRTLRSC